MPTPPNALTPKPAKVPAASKRLQRLAESLKAATEDSNGFYFTPSPAAIEGLPKGKVESIVLGEAGEGSKLLKLTGGDPDAKSGGSTQGFSIRVPEKFEREASTNKVRVEVLARSAAAEPTRVGIAYSTNEVGNSRWRWRDVTPTWGVHKLIWKVPQMKDGRGDFIGLMPDKTGRPGVEIHSVSVTIVKERARIDPRVVPHSDADSRSPR